MVCFLSFCHNHCNIYWICLYICDNDQGSPSLSLSSHHIYLAYGTLPFSTLNGSVYLSTLWCMSPRPTVTITLFGNSNILLDDPAIILILLSLGSSILAHSPYLQLRHLHPHSEISSCLPEVSDSKIALSESLFLFLRWDALDMTCDFPGTCPTMTDTIPPGPNFMLRQT